MHGYDLNLLRTEITHLIESAIGRLVQSDQLPEVVLEVPVEVSDTKSADHGDYACNFALVSNKKAGKPPRDIAQLLSAEILKGEKATDLIQAIEIAGPGFLNIRLHTSAVAAYVNQILTLGDKLAYTDFGHHKKINVEFVSVNPNGPITVGSGRGASFGDTLCRVFTAAGFDTDREYYINDGVNSEQMRLFAESVKSYILELPLPENGYKGEYVKDVAADLVAGALAGKSKQEIESEEIGFFQDLSQELMIARQRTDLAQFGVEFQEWFSEQSLHNSGQVDAVLQFLVDKGVADTEPYCTEINLDPETKEKVEKKVDQEPGALWLRSTRFGDDKDRVLKRSDGRLTYIAADIAYMKNKFERGFEKLIIVLGPDHHGYIGRMNAVCQALGYPLERFEIIIFQIVRFVKDGQPAPMRKRDGNIYELRDLCNEIGTDVARFFYLMRSHDSHMDFDIDLATKQSDENPVFYAQYAHARICSVLNKASENGLVADANTDVTLLTDPREMALIKKILDLPHEVVRSAKDYGVHRLTTYAVELARTYHHFYDGCRVVQTDQPELSKARVALCQAARTGLKCTFDLLGVSAPEHMERAATETATEETA